MKTTLQSLVAELTEGDAPDAILRTSYADGTLKRLIPELDVLYGIPQSAQYHPEVDTGIHIELVVAAAWEITRSPRARFAALVHDFGKGATPQNEWPKHINHEERGVPLVETFCERLGAPDDWKTLGLLTSRWHLHAHRALESRPKTVLEMFEACNFLPDDALLRDFVFACEADKRGRGGDVALAPYPQGPFLLAAAAAARDVVAPAEFLQGNRIKAIADVAKVFADR